MKARFGAVAEVLRNAIKSGVFPCANLEIGNSRGSLYQFSEGYRQVMPAHLAVNDITLFDMASVTKIMVTTMVAMRLVENGLLALSDRMDQFYDNIPQASRDITVKHLLTHTSGLPGNYSIIGLDKDNIDREILSLPPAYPKGTRVEYACLGFILLGRLLEQITGKSLDVLAQEIVFGPLSMNNTGFYPKGENIAATGWGSFPTGIVNDYNARYLGVPVGNAGLFSTLSDCSIFARMLLNGGHLNGVRIISRQTLSVAAANHTPAMDEARGLGFRKLNKGAKIVGELFPTEAFGHCGWTGTSIAIDPTLDLYVVLLTNRTHMPGNNDEEIWRIRRFVHNSVVTSMD